MGFAGTVADAFTLFDKFEQHLEKHQGNLLRAAVGLSKEWRTDKYLRHLDAMLVAADRERLLLLSGDGEIIEPDEDITAIGSGGPFAHAAARALIENTDLPPPRWHARRSRSPRGSASTRTTTSPWRRSPPAPEPPT